MSRARPVRPTAPRPVLRARRRLRPLRVVARAVAGVAGWRTALMLTGMCGFLVAAVWTSLGLSAGLAAVGVSLGFLEIMSSEDDETQP